MHHPIRAWKPLCISGRPFGRRFQDRLPWEHPLWAQMTATNAFGVGTRQKLLQKRCTALHCCTTSCSQKEARRDACSRILGSVLRLGGALSARMASLKHGSVQFLEPSFRLPARRIGRATPAFNQCWLGQASAATKPPPRREQIRVFLNTRLVVLLFCEHEVVQQCSAGASFLRSFWRVPTPNGSLPSFAPRAGVSQGKAILEASTKRSARNAKRLPGADWMMHSRR